MKHRCSSKVLVVALFASLGSACGDDQTGVPQPLPIPSPKLMRLGGTFPGMEAEIPIVGLPKAVDGAGEVQVKNITAVEQPTSTGKATAQGSFYLTITAEAKHTLEVRYRGSKPATLTVPELLITDPRFGPQAIDGVQPIRRVDGQRVEIRGQLPNSDPGDSVFVVNLTTGAVGVDSIDAQLHFVLEVAATAGEQLDVYRDVTPLGRSWRLTAP